MNDELKDVTRIGAAPLPINPEISEEVATQLCILINNHIEQMRAWERKLRQPYYNTDYNKPTVATMLHLVGTMQHGNSEVKRVVMEAMAAMKK